MLAGLPRSRRGALEAQDHAAERDLVAIRDIHCLAWGEVLAVQGRPVQSVDLLGEEATTVIESENGVRAGDRSFQVKESQVHLGACPGDRVEASHPDGPKSLGDGRWSPPTERSIS